MSKLKVGTLFSGIGAFEEALKILNIEHEIVFACDNGEIELDIEEYDKLKFMFDNGCEREQITNKINNIYASCRRQNFVKYTYFANHELKNEDFNIDIRFFDGTKYKGIDLLVGGSPCQSFSTVGDLGGLEDSRGTLFYEFARVVKEIQPKVFIYENVRGLVSHDKGRTWKTIKNIFNDLGYHYKYEIIDAKDYGIPQTRRRLFVVGFLDKKQFDKFNFPKPVELEFTVQDLLLENTGLNAFEYDNEGIPQINRKNEEKTFIPTDCFLSEKLVKYVMSGGTKTFYQKPEIDLKVARTILKTMGNSHRAGIDNYVTSNGKIRRLHEREAARLMGFPDSFKIVVSRSQAYKQFGNSIVVKVFLEIIKEILN